MMTDEQELQYYKDMYDYYKDVPVLSKDIKHEDFFDTEEIKARTLKGCAGAIKYYEKIINGSRSITTV